MAEQFAIITRSIAPLMRLIANPQGNAAGGSPMLENRVNPQRIDAHESVADCKDATGVLDTDIKGRRDAVNPAELRLAAVSARIIKEIERVAPTLKFRARGVEVRLIGVR